MDFNIVTIPVLLVAAYFMYHFIKHLSKEDSYSNPDLYWKEDKKVNKDDQGRYGIEFFSVVLFIIILIAMIVSGVGGEDSIESSGWLRWVKNW